MSATPKPVLGVDLDDVLIRTGDALAAFHNATYGTSYARDEVRDFDLSSIWNCTPEETRQRIDEFFGTDFHHKTEAVLGAREALEKLGAVYDIVIVTGRTEQSSRDATIDLLSRHFLGLYRELHFTSHQDADPKKRRLKSALAKEFEMKAFIDDALHFAEDVASLGIPVLLFDTPWNQGDTSEGITRVRSWEEVLSILGPTETIS